MDKNNNGSINFQVGATVFLVACHAFCSTLQVNRLNSCM